MIAEIQNRLLTAPNTPFAIVEGATQLAQVKDRPTALPAAYVLILQEASAPTSRAMGPVLQRTEADIGVIIVTENVGDARGDAVSDDLELLKRFVRQQLIGFVPEGVDDPIEHVSGEIIKARSGTVWFQDVFGAAYYQEEV
jgi:hypothetical protein